MLCSILAGSVLVITIGRCLGRENVIDDQNYPAALTFIVQIVDIMTDWIFAFQLRSYWKYATTDEYGVDHRPFGVMYAVAMTFFIFPYFINLYSSVTITRKIAEDPMISSYSKKYFQQKSRFYTFCVLLSGGSFRALKFMNSNLFGLRLLSAGLSTSQLQQFQPHHVSATVLTENCPQIALQYYFLFELNLVTSVAVISFTTSVFNVLLCIVTYAVFHILHRHQTEIPFKMVVSWTRISTSVGNVRPFNQCGRRRHLARVLEAIDSSSSFKFEILSSKKVASGC